MRVKALRKLAAALLITAAISVFVAAPAHADGTDMATGFACSTAHYFDPSYYSSYCEQPSSS